MAVLATNFSGHLQNQLTRSLERILEEANQSGELKLSNRKLKDFPQGGSKYNLSDTVIAGWFFFLPASEYVYLTRFYLIVIIKGS